MQCARSANPIGRLLLHLYDLTDPESARRADAICTGLQLANFWQDIALDWRKGRVYLPGDDMARFAVTEEQIAAGRCDERWARLMAFEVERTRSLLESGRFGDGATVGGDRERIPVEHQRIVSADQVAERQRHSVPARGGGGHLAADGHLPQRVRRGGQVHQDLRALGLRLHAHHGHEKGITPGGVHVRNVAQPVIQRAYRVYCLDKTSATSV